MRKILVMVAVAIMAVVNVSAQSAGSMFLKPMVGGTLSTITKADDTKMKLGLVGGAEFGYYIADPFAVTVGVLAAMQGSAFKDNQVYKDQSTTLTYLNVPILANYYIVGGLAVKAGIQPGFLLSAKHKFSENYNGSWHDEEITGTDDMKKFDLSIPVGLSYEFADFVIDARYNFGLTKIYDNEHLDDYKNSVIMLTIGYKINF
jgi:hypothetical protein